MPSTTTKDTSTTPRSAFANEYFAQVASPIGRIEIVSDGTSITGLSIESAGTLPRDGRPAYTSAILSKATTQLGEYFAGQRKVFDLPIRVAGTAFQQEIWAGLQELPWGTVTSYGALGASVGRLGAGRAVGGAVGANPIPIIVPCHRVLASNAKITGYSGGDGIPTKVWLLALEEIAYRS